MVVENILDLKKISSVKSQFSDLYANRVEELKYHYIQLSIEVEDLTIESILPQLSGEYYFFQDNENKYLGIGAAWKHQLPYQNRFNHIKRHIRNLREVVEGDLEKYKLFCGFSFDYNLDAFWEEFGHGLLLLPRMFISSIKNGLRMTINYNTDSPFEEYLESIFTQISEQEQSIIQSSSTRSLDYPVSKEEWKKLIDKATNAMKNSTLDKVVLSRNCKIKSEEIPNVINVISNFQEIYNNCNLFWYQPTDGISFFGASPELLCEVKNDNVKTVALAGTRKRSNDEFRDEELKNDLVESKKDRDEHEIVLNQIIENLESITVNIGKGETGIVKLRNVQHLETKVNAILEREADILTVLEQLHPTPAVGGKPTDLAKDFIATHEEHSRGWYAGPLGILDLNINGKFIVAIRSAIHLNQDIVMYAGAGILPESDAHSEWMEIELKFKPILEALEIKL